ncbi:MAG: M48 family metalloprotease [Alphaproteobacteria bacterium]|nr:M48 family metalloprotease [Alphaproteobacteria bacterium]MBU1514058.1 M48 family metalloprotease [Alphaproteobacteria bacterium]MBU2093002.1 M48 family metalloprotease [Alphaproteobacteria bacterium]MBU2151795.1 M48 family metalloprotease [Alphaproteobacteria bacterium]MBU2309385.1 M48 family metalloprotease [Alphaproteobacteria bacterium]
MKRFALAAALALAAAPAVAQPAREHRQMVAELGGTYLGPQADYVQRIGERMAKAAGMRQSCIFTVVNSEVVNAFTAPPGCYVYVTRGLLGIVNSEAELAAVLGHELGHVAANHAIRQQNTETMGSLAAVLVGVATKSDIAGKLAGRVAKLGALGYSRNQEYEADSLALTYLPAAGYAPEGLTNVLGDLQREGEFTARETGQPQGAMAPWASTHPLTTDRIRRAATQAAKIPPQEGLAVDERSYLAAIDGLPYGDESVQGYVRGTAYIHPQLGIRFDAPRGFQVANEPEAVKVTGPGGSLAEFTGGRASAKQLDAYARQVLAGVVRNGRHEVGQAQHTRINGLETVVLPARASSGGRAVDLTVVVYSLGGDEAYSFVAMAPAGQASLFDPMFDSFRRLSDREVDGSSGRRIAVVDVRPGDTAESLAARMGPDGDRIGRFRMLNALDPGQPLRPGAQVKLIVDGRR